VVDPRRIVVSFAALALVAALVATVAGCGATSSAASAPATTAAGTTTTGGAPGFAAFQACLKQHGVTVSFGGRRFRRPGATGATGGTTTTPPPDGQGNGAPRPGGPGAGGFRRNLNPAQQKAFTACRSQLPAGGFGRRPGGFGGGGNGAFAKYTACLRKHGVTFGATSSGSSTYKLASTACRSLLPTAAPAGTSTTGTTTTG